MAVHSKKVLTQNLTIGMYVSELDRPWIKTDYMIEGFYIEHVSDIEKLQGLCEFVYIDIELTREKLKVDTASEPTFLARIKTIATTDIKDISFNRSKKNTIRRTEHEYKKSTGFATEFRTANQLYNLP